MGNCWAYCAGLFQRESSRLQRGGGSKYFRSSTRGIGEHYTIEFENLVESDEGESPQPCPRPISEDEIKHLRDHHYAAISEKQLQIDQKLHEELEAQEEKLRLEEEARNAAQREAARLARERKAKEFAAQRVRGRADGGEPNQRKQTSGEDFDTYLQNVKAQSEAFRSNRLPSDTNAVTPNTESSWDFTKTRSTNEDGTSLDLEWEDEEGINRSLPPCERSRTEEDILRAALRPGSKPTTSGPTSEDSTALEWENDFISSLPDDGSDQDYQGFVNPVLDTPSALDTPTVLDTPTALDTPTEGYVNPVLDTPSEGYVNPALDTPSEDAADMDSGDVQQR